MLPARIMFFALSLNIQIAILMLIGALERALHMFSAVAFTQILCFSGESGHFMFKFNTIRNLVLGSVAAVFALLGGAQVNAESSVWQIKSNDNNNTLYIAGTIHVLKASDFPLPEEFDEAYAKAENLVFEADLSSFDDFEVQKKMQQMVSWSDGSSLADHLQPETLERFSAHLMSYGIPFDMVKSYKPGFAATTLAMLELQKLGIGEAGVDAFYDEKARADGREIEALETVDQQIGFIAEMGMENPDDFLNFSMNDLEELGEIMDNMTAAWREGDMLTLAANMTKQMREDYPEVFKQLLTDRNVSWIPKIEAMMKDPDVELVMVGAGHLAGEGNVLQLLQEAGYTVKQLP